MPAADGWPWRVLGWIEDDEDGVVGAQVWRSTDTISWTTDRLPGGTGGLVWAGTHGPDGDVAVGSVDRLASSVDEMRDGQEVRVKDWSELIVRVPMTWISRDGTAWQAVVGQLPRIEAVAAGPAGILGLVGTWDAEGDEVTGFEVWQVRSRSGP